jgi:hypothetical protein
VLERLLRQPGKLSDFAGIWADMSETERKDMEDARRRQRKIDTEHAKRVRARMKG